MRTLCLLDPPEHVARYGRGVGRAISGVYRIGIACEPWQVLGYGALRRAVFCEEQGLFAGSDLDEHDRHATPIVAMSYAAGMAVDVVGTVRIHRIGERAWLGSRLAIDGDWRGLPLLAAHLIRAAVCTARLRGCERFEANVQRQNVPLFRRLHWETIGQDDLAGVLHHRMRCRLEHYGAEDALALRGGDDGLGKDGLGDAGLGDDGLGGDGLAGRHAGGDGVIAGRSVALAAGAAGGRMRPVMVEGGPGWRRES